MDAQLFIYLIPVLLGVWGLTHAEVGALGTVSLVSSALGGWGAGFLADRFGRVRVLLGTILSFTAMSVLMAWTTDYHTLLVVRALQGIGFGGEWAVGAVIVGEVAQSLHRAKAVGFVQSAAAVGSIAAAVLSSGCLMAFSPAMAWKVIFLISGGFGALAFALSWGLPEPKIFEATRKNRAQGSSLRGQLSPRFAASLAMGCLLTVGVQLQGLAQAFWMPSYVKQAGHLSSLGNGVFLVALNLIGFAGMITASFLGDRWGRRATFTAFAGAAFLALLFFRYLPTHPWEVVMLAGLLNFFVVGLYANLGAVLTELFPTQVRATAQGFSYNVGKAVGGMSPLAVALIAGNGSVLAAFTTIIAVGLALVVLAAFILPETAGTVLECAPEVADALPTSRMPSKDFAASAVSDLRVPTSASRHKNNLGGISK